MNNGKRILRVFPRRTKATPDDELAVVGDPGLFRHEVDEVHVSVAFTYDRAEGERLKAAYREFYDVVKIGGPGMGNRGENFIPGLYLKPGYVITSRGCPNRCWFCDSWKRDGDIRELPITEGWRVQDDNLFACSEKHIENVFEMLRVQPERPEFSGGIDPKRITLDLLREIRNLKPRQIFTAYDTDDDLHEIQRAADLFRKAGFSRNQMRCYVLIGYPNDTREAAEFRIRETWRLGYLPFAMLYRDDRGWLDPGWRSFQRSWARPAAIKATMRGGN